jgi:hypothetical protein
MARVGILLNASAAEFIAWVEVWTTQQNQLTYSLVQGQIRPGRAEQHIVLGRHLTVEVPGVLTNDADLPVAIPSLIAFQILPVGLGTSTAILGKSHVPELAPYLADFVSAATSRWPSAEPTAWFGDAPSVELCTIRLSANMSALGEVLREWIAGYATRGVLSVSFLSTTESRTLREPIYWTLRLSLPTTGPWQGIDHIVVDCQVYRAPESYSVRMTFKCQDFAYQEAAQLASDLAHYCQLEWPDAQVSYAAEPRRAITAEEPPARQRLTPAVDQRDWAITDRAWELIPNTGWDRRVLELWWRNYPSSAIGRQLGVSPKRVLNRISELRKSYGSGIVPTEMQRRGKNWEEMGSLGS